MFTSCRSPVVVVTVNHKPFVSRGPFVCPALETCSSKPALPLGSGGTRRIEFYHKRPRRLAVRPAVGSVDEAARHALAGARKVYL